MTVPPAEFRGGSATGPEDSDGSPARVPPPPVPVEVTTGETAEGEAWLLAPDPMDAASRVLLRGIAAWAAEWAPGGRARLVGDVASDSATAAGFVEAGEGWALPAVVTARPSDDLAEEMLALWLAVIRAGGAVGFRREATPSDVRPVLDRQLASTSEGRSVLVTSRAGCGGSLVGFGWWELSRNPLFTHVVHLKRFQVHPDLQGRNLGRVQLAGMHRIARDLTGAELCRLDCRSGTGASRFYDACGYVEVGRLPGIIRAAPGDDRDSILMMRRLDGGELRYDGRG